jgi:hypothetical protein
MRAVWILPLLGSIIAGFQFLDSLLEAKSAPQQAAGAAMAICWAVLPYVFARAAESLSGPAERPAAQSPGNATRQAS